MERTFIMIKPDGVQRCLVGKILQRFEDRGMKIVGLKLIQVTEILAEIHYEEHIGKEFYERLKKYITSCPVIVSVIEAPDAVNQVRKMVGVTDPAIASDGTIRATWAQNISRNLIHASDKPESAEREISIYFKPDELLDYELEINPWLFP